MGQTVRVERDQVDAPLSVIVTRDGGITGLTVALRLYNGDDITEFLDFDDGVFKAAGHTTPTLDLDEVGLGLYAVDGGFDLSAITIPAATSTLLAHYEITAGGETGSDVDTVQLADAAAGQVDYIITDQAVYDGTVLVSARVREFPDKATYDLATPDDVPPFTGGLEGATRVHIMTGAKAAATGLGQFTPKHWRKALQP